MDAQQPGDTVADISGVRVLVDAQSLPAVEGATVDFRNDPLQPGFLVEPAPPPHIDVPDAFDVSSPLISQVQSVIEHHVNPGIASHGGHAELVGIKDDVVFVALGGGCQGCSMASVTLKQGIEQILKQAIPRIRAVVDATDHAHGSDPFYTAEKGGESPLHQAAKA
jgi:Fe/S biogenesis protein NfuA